MQNKSSAGDKRPRSRKKAESPEAPVNVSMQTASLSPGAAYDDIARLAYSYWEARGRQGGSPAEDWFRAEQELKSRQEVLSQELAPKRKAVAVNAE